MGLFFLSREMGKKSPRFPFKAEANTGAVKKSRNFFCRLIYTAKGGIIPFYQAKKPYHILTYLRCNLIKDKSRILVK